MCKWNPLDEQSMCLNIDGSVDPIQQTTGLGVVVRDQLGRFISAEAEFIGRANINTVELQALRSCSTLKNPKVDSADGF